MLPPLLMIANVYDHAHQDQAGRVASLSLLPGYRYRRLPSSQMINLGIYADLSSARVFSSTLTDATLILFKPALPNVFSGHRFDGEFMQITNSRNSGSAYNVDNFSDWAFNDKATSMLLVAAYQGEEIRISFRERLFEPLRTAIDSELFENASRIGDPILTWQMWPTWIDFLDEDKRYLKVFQRLRHQSIVGSHTMGFTYYIYLYLDGGRLRGDVAAHDYWVSNGVLHDMLMGHLGATVTSLTGKLNDLIDSRIESWSDTPIRYPTLTDLYYLPGHQKQRPGTGVITGHIWEDVTIVLQR